MLNAILWILRSGARWKELPEWFPSYQTCHRRFEQWVENGTLSKILCCLAEDLRCRGQIDIEECFIDVTFASAKKWGCGVGRTKRGKGSRLMAVANRAALPAAIDVGSTSPHEVTLVESMLANRFMDELPNDWSVTATMTVIPWMRD